MTGLARTACLCKEKKTCLRAKAPTEYLLDDVDDGETFAIIAGSAKT